jgi:hypothetical protein
MFRYTGCSSVIAGLLLGILAAILAFLGLLPGIAAGILAVLGISVLILLAIAAMLASTSHCTEGNLRNCLCRFAELIITAAAGSLLLALFMIILGTALTAVTIVFIALVFLLFLLFGTALFAFVRFLLCQLRYICGNNRMD